MTFALAEAAIKAKVIAAWTRPSVPLYWLSEGVVPPSAPYAMCFIEGHKEKTAAFGGGRGANEFIVYGTVLGIFLVPLGGPIALARAMRDEFAASLRGQRFDGVSVYGVSPIGGGSGADKSRHVSVQALAEFEYRFRG